MPVLRTPTNSRPSNRGSRDSTARYAASGSIPAGAVVVVVMPPLCDGGRAPVSRGSDMAVDRPPPGRLEVGVALLWYATEQSAHLGLAVAAVATEVLIDEILPALAQRVTVFGSTRNSAATSDGVSRVPDSLGRGFTWSSLRCRRHEPGGLRQCHTPASPS